MLVIEELGKKPSEFRRMTGINYGVFEIILGKIESYVHEFKEENPIHKRGRKGGFGLPQSLLLTLLYMRQYHTFFSLGQTFSLSESYTYKRYCYIRFILSQVLDMPAKGLLDSGGTLKSNRGCERTAHRASCKGSERILFR